jgi:hypothetical protein
MQEAPEFNSEPNKNRVKGSAIHHLDRGRDILLLNDPLRPIVEQYMQLPISFAPLETGSNGVHPDDTLSLNDATHQDLKSPQTFYVHSPTKAKLI